MTVPNLIFGAKGDGAHVDLERLYESRLLIQGVSGSGKSTMIRSLLEQTHGKVPQLVVDFDGDFVTLREKYDYVLVGPGGDVPIAIKTAKIMMRRLIELDSSAIFDISDMKFDQRREWVRLACEELVHVPRNLWSARLFILDEAHIFAPERSSGESVATGAVIDVITLGRKRGIVTVCATQRLSKLHKDAAAELNNKLIGYTDDVDLQRAGDQLGMTKEQRAGLKLLDTHTFYAYGPAISRAPVLVRTLMPATSPPPRGQARPEAPSAPAAVRKVLAQMVDLAKEAEEEAKTVADLQRKNADLERRIRHAEKGIATKTVEKLVADPKAIERAVKAATVPLRRALEAAMKFIVNVSTQDFDVAGVDKAELQKAVESAVGKASELIERKLETRRYQANQLRLNAQRIAAQLKTALGAEEEVTIDVAVKRNEPVTVSAALHREPRPPREPRASREARQDGDLGKGERTILTAIAQYPEGAERDQLTVLTGYKRSSRDTYIQRLASGDYVTIENGRLFATSAGVDALGTDFEPLPKGEELQQYWLGRLPEGERAILDILIQQYPTYVDRETLSEATGYKRSSRDTYLQRLGSRRLVEVSRGEVRASAILFEEALV